MYSLTFRVMLT